MVFIAVAAGLVLGDGGDNGDQLIDAGDAAVEEAAAPGLSVAAPATPAVALASPVYEQDVGDLEGLAPADPTPSQGVLSATPNVADEADEPVTTTTAAPAATAPPPTTAAPAPAEEPAPTEGTEAPAPPQDGASTTAPTETTGPGDTAAPTETTAHPEGWVDAGHGIFLPPVMLQIRYCESRDNYQAANPNSSARGAYQFLTGSWAAYGHAERYGVNQAHLASNAQQDEAALLTWQRDGTRPWNASKSCWG
ncbi:MAG: transglycosylase family protein [Actinomycetota bacterium]